MPPNLNDIGHLCHALECDREVSPKLLMCGEHWRRVPRSIKLEVQGTYRRGQGVDKQPNRPYTRAAMRAVAAVAKAEGEIVPWWIEQDWDREEDVHGRGERPDGIR